MAPVEDRPAVEVVEELASSAWRLLRNRVGGFLTAPTEIAELRERIEYLEDSLAAADARAERDESALRPWSEVRR